MGWCGRLAPLARRVAVAWSAFGIAMLTLGLAPPLSVAAPRLASGGPGPGGVSVDGAFGLAQVPSPQGHQASYFQLAIAPGHTVTAPVIVANLAKHAETLVLGRALGVTAGNGGGAFAPVAARCSGPACWVTGLPSRITLPADTRDEVFFTVRVPPRTPPGQYLSGITARRVTQGAPVNLGSNGKGTSTQAVILSVVTIGVAVTVGNPSTLVTRLSIRGVQGVDEGSMARLTISLFNIGQTFAKGVGRAACQVANRWKSYSVTANTVLPGDNALIAVNTPGVPEGATVPCAIGSGMARANSSTGPAGSLYPALLRSTTSLRARAHMLWLPRPGFPAGQSG